MTIKSRGSSIRRSKAIRSLSLALVIITFFAFSFLCLFTTAGERELARDSGRQDLNWRERLILQHLKPLFSKEVIDAIKSSTDDLGPLSVDFFRKNLSASWKLVGQDSGDDQAISTESTRLASNAKHVVSGFVHDSTSNEDHLVSNETPAKRSRRQLREKRRDKRAADLVNQDDEVIIKLENAAIERSKSVDSAVLGKYSIWRKENDNENSDSTVRLIQDQMIMARVYISLARMKSKIDLANELQKRLKESQRSLGDATSDNDFPHSAPEKIKLMGQVLSKAKGQLYDCKLLTGKLRAMLQTADEQVRSLKKQSTFLSQLAAKTIPNGLHCLTMLLTIDYYLLDPEKRKFPRSENLEDRARYHYALFSDNVLAASVVVNSTIMNAKGTYQI